MYTPPHFAEPRLPVLHRWMRENSFATFVSVVDGVPFATHLPALLDHARGEFGVLRAHMAKANPHWQAFADGADLLVIFQGPHAYISPSWYESQRGVPSWNYTAVHAYGPARILAGQEVLELLLDQVALYESNFEVPWEASSQPAGYIESRVSGVVAFEVEITRIEGKGKLSQNRPQDRDRIIETLRASGNPALAVAMSEAGCVEA